jgi:hypothetical protein
MCYYKNETKGRHYRTHEQCGNVTLSSHFYSNTFLYYFIIYCSVYLLRKLFELDLVYRYKQTINSYRATNMIIKMPAHWNNSLRVDTSLK